MEHHLTQSQIRTLVFIKRQVEWQSNLNECRLRQLVATTVNYIVHVAGFECSRYISGSMLQYVAVCGSVLQYVACVAVCC